MIWFFVCLSRGLLYFTPLLPLSNVAFTMADTTSDESADASYAYNLVDLSYAAFPTFGPPSMLPSLPHLTLNFLPIHHLHKALFLLPPVPLTLLPILHRRHHPNQTRTNQQGTLPPPLSRATVNNMSALVEFYLAKPPTQEPQVTPTHTAPPPSLTTPTDPTLIPTQQETPTAAVTTTTPASPTIPPHYMRLSPFLLCCSQESAQFYRSTRFFCSHAAISCSTIWGSQSFYSHMMLTYNRSWLWFAFLQPVEISHCPTWLTLASSSTACYSTLWPSRKQERQNRACSYCPSLTHALLEGYYVPAARVMTLAATATTERDNALLRYALQTLHLCFPEFERDSYIEVVQWLFAKHGVYLRDMGYDLTTIQARFGLRFSPSE